jgi:tripeptidyl-peptidase-2
LKRERGIKWNIKVAELISEANEAVCKLEEASKDKADSAEMPATKLQKQDLKDRLAYLTDLKLEDPGPILDVVVWHDGTQACHYRVE